MKKLVKFLIVGAIAITSHAQAITNNKVVDLIHIQQLVQNQKEKGFLPIVTELELNTIKDTSDIFQKEMEENNRAIIDNGECKVSLTFTQNGDSISLADNDIVMSQLKNEEQKKLMREFIALHEINHCEFSSINNPFFIKNKSEDFNNKFNYYIKDISYLFGKASYIDLLSETFADVSAKVGLIKEYGDSNKNLNFVLNLIENQRAINYNDNFYQKPEDPHFSQFGLKEISKKENIEIIKQLKNNEEIQKFILEISNKSVQKIIITNPLIENQILDKDAIKNTVVFNLGLKISAKLNPKEGSYSKWLPNVNQGFGNDLADKILLDKNILKGLNKNSSDEKIMAVIDKYIKDKKIDLIINNAQEDFTSMVKELEKEILIKNQANIKEHKIEVLKKIIEFKNNFKEPYQSNNLDLKLK